MGIVWARPTKAKVQSSGQTLTIRNLTITPLELTRVERLESKLAHLKAKKSTASGAVALDASSSLKQTDILTGITVAPFRLVRTEIPAPDATGHEVLRLTFSESENEDGTLPTRYYMVDVPGPSNHHSPVITAQGGPDDANDTTTSTSTPKGLTVIFLSDPPFLTLLSSASLSSWMAALPSHLPLSALSIPGTHNSPTHHVALPSVRCQAVPLHIQLSNGVRFLDVRVSVPATPPPSHQDDITLVHSAFPISLTGPKRLHSHLLSRLYTFLTANPTETILLSLKREGLSRRATDANLSLRLAGPLYTSGAYSRFWFTQPRIPNLGEARGKIVLIRRFALDESLKGYDTHGASGWGIDGSIWPDNCADGTCGGGMIRVQDFYDVSQPAVIAHKVELARAHCARAATELGPLPDSTSPPPGPPPLFINFLSASSFFNAACWPERVAAGVNPSIVKYLCMTHGETGEGSEVVPAGKAPTGIIVTDWVGHDGDWDLIRCVVGWNARLQVKV